METTEITPINVLSHLASTSTQIDVFSDSIIESVKNGEVDALKVHMQLKAMEIATERIKKEIRDNVLTAADKFPGDKFEFMGNEVQKCDVYTEYDFGVCKDSVWEQRDAIAKAAIDQRKEREAFLKAIKGHQDIVTEDGEGVRIFPPLKKSIAGLKIKIK